MRKKELLILVLFTLYVFFGCDKNENSAEKPLKKEFVFKDGFETQNNSLNELFPSDNSRWTTIQQTNPSNAINEISITSDEVFEGQNAIRFLSYKSDSQLSKIDIEKNGLLMQKGDKVNISAKFYVKNTVSLENLFLIDLECCSCWDPSVGDNYGSENQCPGVRLMMSGSNNYLSIERGKISGSTLLQTNYAFPINQWVSIEWKLTLSDTDNGENILLINGVEVINEKAMNMPNAQIFKEVFLNEGINFTLQEPLFYERVQIGATANPVAENIELFVDDFSIIVEN